MPCYEPGGQTRLEPLSRSAALQILPRQSFSVPKHSAFGIGTLTHLRQDVDCYRLIFSSLDDATALVTALPSYRAPIIKSREKEQGT